MIRLPGRIFGLRRQSAAATALSQMGGAGDPPVPVGDPPTGTRVATPSNRPSKWVGDALPVPSGDSPDGTGQRPVLPKPAPEQKVPDHATVVCYQSRVTINSKPYLLRVMVEEAKQPPVVVTVYRTSKISKYWSQT